MDFQNLFVKTPLFVVSLLSLAFTTHAYAEQPMVMKQVTPSENFKIEIFWPQVHPDHLYNIAIVFLDPSTDQLLNGETISYSVVVLQKNATIENYRNETTSSGSGSFQVAFPTGSVGSAQVIITILSDNPGSGSIPINQEVSFNVMVVPEFSTLSAMVLAFSVGAALALSRFKNLTKLAFWHT